MTTKIKPTISSSDPNTNDNLEPHLSFEQAMGIIAKTPKHIVDQKMKDFKGKKYNDIAEPKEAKPKKKSPK